MRALVTGASRGIGAALVSEGRARGHEVQGTGRDGGDIRLDVTDPQAQARAARDAGPLDLLVCNAGVFLDRGSSIAELTAGAARRQLRRQRHRRRPDGAGAAANLSRGGRIAIISSQMGSSAMTGGGAYAYRASKAAAINLAFNLAADLRDGGIAVGVYHPGWVRTDMGGAGAAISPEASARGLWDRFEALDLATTGRFETWDGTPHPV